MVRLSRNMSIRSGFNRDDRLEPRFNDGLGRAYAFWCGHSCGKSEYNKYEMGSFLFLVFDSLVSTGLV